MRVFRVLIETEEGYFVFAVLYLYWVDDEEIFQEEHSSQK